MPAEYDGQELIRDDAGVAKVGGKDLTAAVRGDYRRTHLPQMGDHSMQVLPPSGNGEPSAPGSAGHPDLHQKRLRLVGEPPGATP